MIPLVSIVIAAHDEARHLAECLESLRRQSYRRLEVLVVDDGSRDNTRAVAERFEEVKILRQAHLGTAEARNRGARAASGEILFFLDGDMVFEKDYVRAMVDAMEASQAVGAAHAEERVANPGNSWAACLQRRSGLPPEARLVLDGVRRAEGSTVFRAVRRERFLAVGGFDDTGYLDDHTLAPKLGAKAIFVEGAVCAHYNPETLAEVLCAGRWAGKTVAARHGPGAVVRSFPGVGTLEAVIRYRSLAMAVFETVYRWGMFVGGVSWMLGRKGMGK